MHEQEGAGKVTMQPGGWEAAMRVKVGPTVVPQSHGHVCGGARPTPQPQS